MPADDPRIPAFGQRTPGQPYVLRLSAYAVLVNPAGLLAVVRTGGRAFLPGGGAAPGESAADTVRREVREECGLIVATFRPLGIADEFVYAAAEGTYLQK